MPFAAIALLILAPAESPAIFSDRDAFLAKCPQARISFSFDGPAPAFRLDDGCMAPAHVLHGVTFMGPGAPLEIVRGDDTRSPSRFFEDVESFGEGSRLSRESSKSPMRGGDSVALETRPVDATHARLAATSGERLLSPGGAVLGPGPDPAIEDDDLTLLFDAPIRAFGFDLLSQSRDGQSNVTIRVYDGDGALVHEGDVSIGSSEERGSGADFWGIVAPAAMIARIEIDERDDNDRFPDSNVGFDSLRIVPQPCDADFDGDLIVTDADFTAFVARHRAGEPVADLDGDGAVDRADLHRFLQSMAAFARE